MNDTRVVQISSLAGEARTITNELLGELSHTDVVVAEGRMVLTLVRRYLTQALDELNRLEKKS